MHIFAFRSTWSTFLGQIISMASFSLVSLETALHIVDLASSEVCTVLTEYSRSSEGCMAHPGTFFLPELKKYVHPLPI